jgi:hypothetical protein
LRAEGTPATVRKWTSSVEELETADRYRSAGQKTNKLSSPIHRTTILYVVGNTSAVVGIQWRETAEFVVDIQQQWKGF